jgi:hypothetical protein
LKPKRISCITSEQVQDKLAVHDFIAQGMEHKTKLILRTGSRVLIFHFRFKTSEKNHCMKRLKLFINFCHKAYQGGGAYVQYFLDIVLERDVRNQAGIADFFEFLG